MERDDLNYLDEFTLYDYWMKDLSFLQLHKSEELKVKYDIVYIVLLGMFFISIGLMCLNFPIAHGIPSVLFMISFLLSIISIFFIFKMERYRDWRYLVDTDNLVVNIKKLREKKINDFLDMYCIEKRLIKKNVCSELEKIYRKQLNRKYIPKFSDFICVIGLLLSILLFIFKDVKETKETLMVSGYCVLIFVYLMIMYAWIKFREDSRINAYESILHILETVPSIEKKQDSENLIYILSEKIKYAGDSYSFTRTRF